jgi:hypothetical protein
VVSGSDHRTLWIDIDYRTAFGHDGSSPIIKPSARCLNNKNPNIRDNFNALRQKYAENCSLLERIIVLEESIQGEMTADQIKEYEALDQLRRCHIRRAENRCRKLRKGNVQFSEVLQDARNKVSAWSLLLRQNKGLKTSSRKISRSLKKAGLPSSIRGYCYTAIMDELQLATKKFYTLKKYHKELRMSHLEQLASAIASSGNLKRASILKQLRHRESQRTTARKIKYLRGKLSRNSTTMVTVKLDDGSTKDITDKREMEKAIIVSNKKNLSNHSTPHFIPSLTTKSLGITDSLQLHSKSWMAPLYLPKGCSHDQHGQTAAKSDPRGPAFNDLQRPKKTAVLSFAKIT